MIPMFSGATARKAPSSAFGTGCEKKIVIQFGAKKLTRKGELALMMTRF